MSTKTKEWTIGEMTNYVCANLMEGWEVVMRLENGSGVVSLFDPTGCEVGLCEDDSLEVQIKEAVSYAKEHDERT